MSANTVTCLFTLLTWRLATDGRSGPVHSQTFHFCDSHWRYGTAGRPTFAALQALFSLCVLPVCHNKRTIGRVQHVLMCRFHESKHSTSITIRSRLSVRFRSDYEVNRLDASFLCTETLNMKRFVRYFRTNVKPKLKNTTFSSLLIFSFFWSTVIS